MHIRIIFDQIDKTKPKTHRIVMGALMFGTIRTVAERLRASIVLAAVRSFARMRSLVDLKILQSRKGLITTAKLWSVNWSKRTNDKGH